MMYMYYLLGFRLWGEFGEIVNKVTAESQHQNSNTTFVGNNWLERRIRLRSQKKLGTSSDQNRINKVNFEDLGEGILEQVSSNFYQPDWVEEL